MKAFGNQFSFTPRSVKGSGGSKKTFFYQFDVSRCSYAGVPTNDRFDLRADSGPELSMMAGRSARWAMLIMASSFTVEPAVHHRLPRGLRSWSGWIGRKPHGWTVRRQRDAACLNQCPRQGTAAPLINQFRYSTIAPIAVVAGQNYRVGVYYPDGNEPLLDFVSNLVVDSRLAIVGGRWGRFGFPRSHGGQHFFA